MLRTEALEYDLPPGMIATHPARPRDSARMMVVRRERRGADPSPAEHTLVRDLPRFLRAGDVLVLNTTRVLRARFMGEREDSGGKVDGLYLGPVGRTAADGERWRVLLKCRRTRPGVFVRLHDRDGQKTDLRLKLIQRDQEGDAESGGWVVELAGARPGARAPQVLEEIGLTPLPPYIRQARKTAHQDAIDEEDRRDYQTVFAHEDPRSHAAAPAPPRIESDGLTGVEDAAGSVAAPTAGLHFTPELLSRLGEMGVRTAEVVLHVGMGTFKPVESKFLAAHPMHAEWCRVPAESGRLIEDAKRRGERVIAVGTTAARTLESFPEGLSGGTEGWTRLLIAPGYGWRWVDGMLTNFHLPRSTLMAMVSALLGEDEDSVERLKGLYGEAIERGYRFYSFGDAMLVLP